MVKPYAFLVGGWLLLTALPAAAQQQPMYGQWGMMGGGWFGMVLWPLIMIAVVAGVIVLIVLAVRGRGGASSPPGAPPGGAQKTAIDILKERFARGEIDREEYEERRRLLEK